MRSRWRKVWGDVRSERSRLALLVLGITVSLAAVGTVLGAWAVLTRDIAINYLGTKPADVTLEFEDGVDDALLEAVRRDASVREADRREVSLARVRVGDDVRPLLLFVPDDFTTMALNRFTPHTGAWPPPDGTVLLERSALGMAQAQVGDTLDIKTPHGALTATRISGTVYDPGLAPAWQEREVYAYATRNTLRQLGESAALHELRVTFRATLASTADAEHEGQALASRLAKAGWVTHQLRVPPLGQHPHQRQMATILMLLGVFAGLALVLSSTLVATTFNALLARQVREVGVMKTLGATASQLAAMYTVMVAGIGVVSFALSLPLAQRGERALTSSVSAMLNFELTSQRLPMWVMVVQALAGVAVPLLFALWPILRAVRLPVRAALDSHGVSQRFRAVSARWPVVVRNLLRRPARLAFTVSLLSLGSALFMTAAGLARAWERNVESMYATRHYDVEVRFNEAPPGETGNAVTTMPALAHFERWGTAPAAFVSAARLEHPLETFDVVRTYPDRGHGSFVVLAPPIDTTLVNFPLLEGRRLTDGDDDVVVLNHVARAQSGAHTGTLLTLSVDGAVAPFRVVGVVEEIGSPAVAYVTPRAFSRLTHGAEPRMWRIASTAVDPSVRLSVIRDLERRLANTRASVEAVVPFAELRTAVGDHVFILVQALMMLAVVLALVGLLGLTSTVGISVLERSREIGVLKTLGATRADVARSLLGEALTSSALSWVVGVAVSIPLTAGIETFIGKLGFLAPLPFTMAPWAVGGWAIVMLVATLFAAWAPIARATAMSVREALNEPE